MTTVWIALPPNPEKLALGMRDRDRNTESPEAVAASNSGKKPGLVDRVFGLLEGTIATSFVKLIATAIISASTIAIVAVLAFTSAPISLVLSTIGLSTLGLAIVWIFGRCQKPPNSLISTSEKKVQAMERRLSDLEERITNVEIIERFEDRLASQASGPIPSRDDSPASTSFSSSNGEPES